MWLWPPALEGSAHRPWLVSLAWVSWVVKLQQLSGLGNFKFLYTTIKLIYNCLMKKSSGLSLLPFEAEGILFNLAQRVVLTRRTLGLTQADLAAKAGVGLSTIVAIEKGAPTVQLGFWLSALWALDLLKPFADLTQLGLGTVGSALLEAQLPQRVRSRKRQMP